MRATLIGAIAVIIWGIAAPSFRFFEEQMGVLAAAGIINFAAGALALLTQMIRNKSLPVSKAVLAHPSFWGRGLFFTIHEALFIVAITLVSREHLPIVILVNYLWPTAIILCAVAFAGVQIRKPIWFMTGCSIVIASLAAEILWSNNLNFHTVLAAPGDWLAYLLVFIGAVSWGIYSALTRRYADRSGGSRVTPLFQFTLGLCLPLALLPQFSTGWHVPACLWPILAVYCLASLTAYRAWDYGMTKGNIVVLSLFADVIPWLSLCSTALMLGVSVSPLTCASAVTLVLGALITRYATSMVTQKPAIVPIRSKLEACGPSVKHKHEGTARLPSLP